MRLIADEHGYFELHEVKRFAEAWEGPASLRIRAGDATAVREYIERGRVLEGTEERGHGPAGEAVHRAAWSPAGIRC